MANDICSPLNRGTYISGASESVVYNKQYLMLFADVAQHLKIGYREIGVGNCLYINGFGVLVNKTLYLRASLHLLSFTLIPSFGKVTLNWLNVPP